jgi:hypothetical protein
MAEVRRLLDEQKVTGRPVCSARWMPGGGGTIAKIHRQELDVDVVMWASGAFDALAL